MKEFKWFLGILVLLGFVWFFNGGPERASSRDPFIHQPSPLGEGTTYTKPGFWDLFRAPFSNTNSSGYEGSNSGWSDSNPYGSTNSNDISTNGDSNTENSTYANHVSLEASSAYTTDPSLEYLTIRISSNAPESIVFDDWKLRSKVTGSSVSIAKASYLPRMGAVNEEQTVKAQPGDTLVVHTSRSPIGASFRLNKCTGYLSQFQSFYPSIPRQCPRPVDEIPNQYAYNSNPNAFNDACIDFIERIGTCRINTEELPLNMQSQCQEFITKKLNYNGCISEHSNEEGFYDNEWRIYLKRDSALWKDRREIIELVDSQGNVVDTVRY